MRRPYFAGEHELPDRDRELLGFFAYAHLPPELQEISRDFYELAWKMTRTLQGHELTAGLRKLLEAKDCMVRAALPARGAAA